MFKNSELLFSNVIPILMLRRLFLPFAIYSWTVSDFSKTGSWQRRAAVTGSALLACNTSCSTATSAIVDQVQLPFLQPRRLLCEQTWQSICKVF